MLLATLTVIAHSGWSEVWLLGGVPVAVIAAWELWDRRRRGRRRERTEREPSEA